MLETIITWTPVVGPFVIFALALLCLFAARRAMRSIDNLAATRNQFQLAVAHDVRVLTARVERLEDLCCITPRVYHEEELPPISGY
jgi:hypothetical protein